MDVKSAFFGTQAGQPDESVGESQAAMPNSGTPTSPATGGLTEDAVRKILAEELDAHNRKQQGLRRQFEERLKKETAAQIDLLKTSGVTVDESMARNIQQNVANRLTQESQPDNTAQQPAQVRPPQNQVANPLEREIGIAQQWMEEAGIDIEQTDPEAASIDFTSPAKFLKTVQAAIDKKKERVSAATTRQSAVNTAGVSGSVGIGSDMQAEYNKELNKVRGNVRAVTQLQQKYRKLGLNI